MIEEKFIQWKFPDLRYACINKQPRLFTLLIIQTFLPGHSNEITGKDRGKVFR